MATNRQIFCFSLLLLCAPILNTAWAGFVEDNAERIGRFLEETFADGDAGMVIGLVDEGGSRVLAAGVMDGDAKRQVDGQTVFEIGSNTKTFTALLLMDMVNRGRMKLDDPVSKYLPAHVKVPSRNGRPITLGNLAAQDSGLPFNADNLSSEDVWEAFAAYGADDLYEFLSAHELAMEPGERFAYSNIGMSLLGHVIELESGVDYESLVVERICRPLGMNDTRIALTPELESRFATGHDKNGEPALPTRFEVMAGTGALRSTADDMLKYLAAHIGLSRSELTPLMRQMQIVRHSGSAEFGKSAMPWFDFGVYNPPGSQLLGHSGATAGFSTFIGFDTLGRRGVVVLSNQRALPSGGIGWAILQGMPLTRQSATQLVRQYVGVGIGLGVDPRTGKVLVSRVFDNSSASQAGVTVGQVIAKINDVAVGSKTPAECMQMMKGPIGTKIRLEVLDPQRNEARVFELLKQEFLTSG